MAAFILKDGNSCLCSLIEKSSDESTNALLLSVLKLLGFLLYNAEILRSFSEQNLQEFLILLCRIATQCPDKVSPFCRCNFLFVDYGQRISLVFYGLEAFMQVFAS